MTGMVLFTLWAPLAAMGDVAVGERRAAFDRPARSAVMGLLAGALGLTREDDDAHVALDAGYALALQVLSPGRLLQDYHTVQAPAARKGLAWPTRAAALAADKVETLLSLRDYRQDPVVTVAMVARGEPRWSPDMLAAALRRPVFAPYFGRKACPLGLPFAPLVFEGARLAAGFAAARDARTGPERRVIDALGLSRAVPTVYADRDIGPDGDDLLVDDYRILRVESRRDRSVSRRRWQFEQRDEIVAQPVLAGVPA